MLTKGGTKMALIDVWWYNSHSTALLIRSRFETYAISHSKLRVKEKRDLENIFVNFLGSVFISSRQVFLRYKIFMAGHVKSIQGMAESRVL